MKNLYITHQSSNIDFCYSSKYCRKISFEFIRVESNDNVLIYWSDDLNNSEIIKKIKISDKSFAIIYPIYQIFNEIYDSFNYRNESVIDKINKQVEVDLLRTELIINGKISNYSQFSKLINKYRFYKNDLINDLTMFIKLLCTQAIFYYGFFTIQSIYDESDNIHLVSDNNKTLIDIIELDDRIEFTFVKSLKYINIDTSETIKIYKVCQILTIHLIENNAWSDIMMIYWQ